ncbi:hypothetical protein MMC20_001206 [Loxospora ochrophaea]|nr:hypothetical protein [Loxospora ochrophaea]
MSLNILLATLLATALAAPAPKPAPQSISSLGGSSGIGIGGLSGLGSGTSGSSPPLPSGLSGLGGLDGLGGSLPGGLSGLGGLGGLGGAGASGSLPTLPTGLSGLGGLGGGSSGLGGLGGPVPRAAQTSGSSSLGGETASDVQNGVCKPLTYIFARGTTEGGNMGETVGPALETQLKDQFGASNVAVQGVNYPASVEDVVEGSTDPKDTQGSTDMAQLTNQALSNCATTKVVLAGYSQGAQQVHGALMNLQPGQASAAVTFGDPLRTQAFQNIDADKTKIYCAAGDEVCNDEFVISAAHLSYASTDAAPAATFIKSVIQ